MKPGDKLICLFINDYLVGDSFKEWPLHITVIPWFRVGNIELLVKELTQSLKYSRGIKLTIGEEQFFGNSDKLVNIIKSDKALLQIEKTSRELLKKSNAWIVDETTKTRRAFKPHITVQKNERMHQGDKLQVSTIYIIEQKGSSKEVIKAINLNEEA